MLQECQPCLVQLIVVLRYQQPVTKACGHCQPLRAVKAEDQADGLMRPLLSVLLALYVSGVKVFLNAGNTKRAPGGAVFGYLFLRVGPARINQRGIHPGNAAYPAAD